jgi:SIR2-like domain
VSAGPATPSADSISVAETLELLEGRFAPLARGVADGRYALWLGSGISRARTPNLSALILKVLEFLHTHMNAGEVDCPHRKALEQAVALAALRPPELAQVQLDDPPSTWPVIGVVVDSLCSRYSELLGIRVDGEEPDYLVWNAVDVRTTYSSRINPDCEHLCLGILVLEGAVTDIASANWDGLIESALTELSGELDAVLRVIVLPSEFRDPEVALTLLKFHGCAVLAARDPAKYRKAIVATRSQITIWNTSHETKPMCDNMVSLATTKPTLMIGLSAQDENIQQVFAQAKADMEWSWPAEPPAHVFADDQLGPDHINILRVVYGDAYDANAGEIERQALIRAYGKAILTALVLSVLTAKLRAYLQEVDAPRLRDADHELLADGLNVLCRRLAVAADPDRRLFVEKLICGERRALTLFREGVEPAPGVKLYKELGNLPARRVKTDAALETSGVRELAAALALLGRGEANASWSLGIGEVASGARGALTIATGESETAVFFAANGKAAVRLQAEGVLDPTAADVILIHSTEPVKPAVRSPGGTYGRTGRSRIREVDMSEMLRTCPDLDALEDYFRQAAAL